MGIAFAVYLATMPRRITLEDAGLFQMVCGLGGISHPPGYPLFTTACQAIAALPLPPIIRGNLVSAIFAALAAGWLFLVAERLFRSASSSTGFSSRSVAWVASLSYALSATFWSQAIIIEVYSLAALLFLICWYWLILFVETRKLLYWYAAAFTYGLALSNHWPLMILSSPALAVTLVPARATLLTWLREPGIWLRSFLLFGVGLAPYATLLLANSPEIAVYGPVQTPGDLAGYIARRTYDDSHVGAVFFDKVRYAGWLMWEGGRQFGYVGAFPLVLGIVVSLRQRDHRTLSLVLLFAGTTVVLAFLIGFRFTYFYQAIFRPYPVIAFVAAAIWLGLGAEVMLARIGKRPLVAGAAITALVIAIGLSNLATNNRRDSVFTDKYANAVLSSLPAGAIVFVNGDNQVGPLGYLHHLERIRPDVELRDWENLVFSNRLGSPFASEQDKRAAIEQFMSETAAPVFTIEPWLSPATNFGLYYQWARGGEGGYQFHPAVDEFLDFLLTLQEGDFLRDPHERTHAFHLTAAFARQYAGYLFRVGDGTRPQGFDERHNRLMRTFAGKLMMLEALHHQPRELQDPEVMLALANAASARIPAEANAQTLAVFYEFVGRSYLLAGDLQLASEAFARSIKRFPVPENTSICVLRDLLEDSDPEAAEALAARFPATSC